MTDRAELPVLLPVLRRYARAALGHVAAGDAALQTALPALHAEALRTADASREAGGDPGIDPHWPLRWRLLAVLVRSIDAGRILPMVLGRSLREAVVRLPRDQRHALLLQLLEDMPAPAIAAVLGLPVANVVSGLAAARASLRAFLPARVMIIEDDAVVASHLVQVVEQLGHEVCATTASEAAAFRVAREHRPELILADVHLGRGGSGLAAAQRILAETRVPVVFVTGYPDLLQAERNAFVVRKPYQETALRSAIGQALATRSDAHAV